MKFKPWSKYQDVSYDISLFVPFAVSADKLCDAIKNAHQNITDVKVVDFFEKPEWQNHRAITVRYTMSDTEKTMTKQDLDAIVNSVTMRLRNTMLKYHYFRYYISLLVLFFLNGIINHLIKTGFISPRILKFIDYSVFFLFHFFLIVLRST